MNAHASGGKNRASDDDAHGGNGEKTAAGAQPLRQRRRVLAPKNGADRAQETAVVTAIAAI
jgi:hypothetical protein